MYMLVCRGYYMVARRYEFYVRVGRLVSHSFTVLTREILCLPREHKIHILELTCNVLFIINIYWWQCFWWSSQDFWPLPKDFQRFSKIVPKARQMFLNIFQEFSENFQRCPKIVDDFREAPKMFPCYTNKFKYNLRGKLDISEIINIFTCEDIISNHMWGYRIIFYQLVTTRYTTDFYIITLCTVSQSTFTCI